MASPGSRSRAEEPQPVGSAATSERAGGETEAPQESPSDLTTLSLEQLTEVEIGTVYGAAKHDQKVTDAPSSVTIITADDIRKYGYRNLADILRSIGGLFTTNDRNYQYLGIRGFNRPGDYNSRVLLLVDDHRINDNVYDQAPIGNEFPVDVDLIDHLEVIRGPGSALYGSNAFFSVINIVTRRGSALKAAEISGQAASFNTYKGRLSYGQLFSNGIDLLLSGSAADSEGQTFHFKEFDAPATQNGIARDADHERYYNLLGQIAYKQFTLQAAYAWREKGIPTGSFGVVFGDTRNRTIDERYYADLKYENSFGDIVSVTARAFYDWYYYGGDYVYDRTVNAGTIRVVNKDTGIGQWVGGELKLSSEIMPRNRVTVGSEVRQSFQQDQRNADVQVFLDEKKHSWNAGVYFQDELSILENLTLSAGARYDYYQMFGGSTNPRVGLVYHPFEKTTLKLLYGEAFRVPNAYELFYGDSGQTQKGNAGLDPETIRTYEAVLEQYFGAHYRLSASAFHYDIKNLITQVIDPADGLLQFRNIDKVEANGLALDLTGQWASGLKARMNYALEEAVDKSAGGLLTNSPKHLIKLNLSFPLVEEKVFTGVEAQYTSKRRGVQGHFSDYFFLVNLTLYSVNLLEGLEASASLYNLFDARYSDPVGNELLQEFIVQDGRSFRFQLTYRF